MLFRQVRGYFAPGVTVIATADEDRPVGLAVGSFFSGLSRPWWVDTVAPDSFDCVCRTPQSPGHNAQGPELARVAHAVHPPGSG